MAKAKTKLARLPPKRTITKQQAVRHLIHCAGRMIAAGEDPFAIHVLIQSADKLLIDLGKKMGKKLVINWAESVKPEYKNALITSIRETYNFFKHADKDHNSNLYVAEIAKVNFFQLAICIVNYQAIFGEWTDHMKLLFNIAKFISPEIFVPPDLQSWFDEAVVSPMADVTLGEFLNGWWANPIFQAVLPKLQIEKAEDLQDTHPLYDTSILNIIRKN
jgi:hypothetical protein